jgi:hypothetical protein
MRFAFVALLLACSFPLLARAEDSERGDAAREVATRSEVARSEVARSEVARSEVARREVDRLLGSQQRDFAQCFEKTLKKGRLIADATLYFEVEPRGRATHVQVKMPGFVPRTLARCIARRIEMLRFPPEASFLNIEHRIQIVDPSMDRPQRR